MTKQFHLESLAVEIVVVISVDNEIVAQTIQIFFFFLFIFQRKISVSVRMVHH